MDCKCGCGQRIAEAKEARVRAIVAFDRLTDLAQRYSLRNRSWDPMPGWRLVDILGAPMSAETHDRRW